MNKYLISFKSSVTWKFHRMTVLAKNEQEILDWLELESEYSKQFRKNKDGSDSLTMTFIETDIKMPFVIDESEEVF